MKPIELAALVLACLIALAGCSNRPSDPLSPSIVGVITNDETSVISLADGTTFDIHGARGLAGNGRPPSGQLLLAGEHDGERWYFHIPAESRRCPFTFGSYGDAWEEEDSFVFEVGFRLPKADDFEPLRGSRDIEDPVFCMLCINEQGEVIGEAG